MNSIFFDKNSMFSTTNSTILTKFYVSFYFDFELSTKFYVFKTKKNLWKKFQLLNFGRKMVSKLALINLITFLCFSNFFYVLQTSIFLSVYIYNSRLDLFILICYFIIMTRPLTFLLFRPFLPFFDPLSCQSPTRSNKCGAIDPNSNSLPFL